MNKLKAPFLSTIHNKSSIEHISDALDTLAKNQIKNLPWPVYDYSPKVLFSIAHGNDCIFLKFYVSENTIQANHRSINDPVYRDSCVEFFIAFNGDNSYYNLEFNCLGTCRAGYGRGRNERQLLSKNLISQIQYLSVISPFGSSDSDIHWQLTLVIPVSVFHKHPATELHGLKSKVNFYKCGDDLPRPHFLTWNNIVSADEPNFHLPEFFGEMEFI